MHTNASFYEGSYVLTFFTPLRSQRPTSRPEAVPEMGEEVRQPTERERARRMDQRRPLLPRPQARRPGLHATESHRRHQADDQLHRRRHSRRDQLAGPTHGRESAHLSGDLQGPRRRVRSIIRHLYTPLRLLPATPRPAPDRANPQIAQLRRYPFSGRRVRNACERAHIAG
jgi:hypothetical protein